MARNTRSITASSMKDGLSIAEVLDFLEEFRGGGAGGNTLKVRVGLRGQIQKMELITPEEGQ